MFRLFKGFDFTLIITPILLALFGTVMIYSASMVSTTVLGLESTYYFHRQIVWFLLGLIVFWFLCFFPYRYFKNLIKLMMGVSFVLLVVVLFFGELENNAIRSINVFGFNMQPSELVKLVIIIYLAYIFTKKQAYIHHFIKGVLPPLLLVLVYAFLIFIQPDIGTMGILLLIIATMIISAGVRWRHILLLVFASTMFIIIIIPVVMTEKRWDRVFGAYDPFSDPSLSGHHLIQSYLAISGGGLSGEGLGQSVQKLGYLWGAHTDFIMSVIAEELGIFGVFIVVGLLLLIILRGLYIANKCQDNFGTLLAIGISSMIAFQAFINLGAISGVLPITGVTLPFVSYGGSSLLVLMASMGILNNIAKNVNLKEMDPKSVREIDNDKVVQPNRGGQTWSS